MIHFWSNQWSLMLPEDCPYCIKYEKMGRDYVVTLEYGETREKFLASLDMESNAQELLRQLSECLCLRKDFRTDTDVENIYSGIQPGINLSFIPDGEK